MRNADEHGQLRSVEAAAFSPLELNALYEGLQQLLALNQPPKIGILLCIRFLDALAEQRSHAWQAFGWEIAGFLARRLQSVSLWGLSPAELGRIESILLHAMKLGSIPGQNTRMMEKNFVSALDALRDHQPKLDRMLRSAPGSGPSTERRDSQGESSIMIPVIERLNAAGHAPEFFSGIQKGSVVLLHVVASDRSCSKERGRPPHSQERRAPDDAASPEIFGPIPGRTAEAFREAAARLDSLGHWAIPAGRPRLDECVLSIRFTPEEARLDGDSAGLAFILAAATARASLAPGRWSTRLAPGLAATGVLEATSVAPVEARSLDAKVEAAFYSQVSLLLVPASQESAARACLERLLRAHPQRDLSLRGVSDAAEIPSPRHRVRRDTKPPRTLGLGDALLADARGATRTAASWVRWLGRSKWRTAVVLAVAIAGFAILGWETYRQWPAPADIRWIDDRRLEMTNRRGVVFRQINIPGRPRSPEISPVYGVWLGVVNAAGGLAARAFVIHGSGLSGRDLLSVIDWRGRVVWSVHASPPVQEWGSALDKHIWYPFLPLDSIGSGHCILLTSRSTQEGWCVLYIVEQDGSGHYSLRGGLLNDGHLERFPRLDLTGDGKDELVALGTHNGWLPDAAPGSESKGRAIAAVLDPEAMSERSLPQDFDKLPLVSSGETLGADVLAAWTFANDRFTNQTRAHAVVAERIGDDRIRIIVLTASLDIAGSGCVFYNLIGTDVLRPDDVEVIFTDGYRAWIRHEYRDIDVETAIPEESERLRREVMALTPEGWRPVAQIAGHFSARPADGN